MVPYPPINHRPGYKNVVVSHLPQTADAPVLVPCLPEGDRHAVSPADAPLVGQVGNLRLDLPRPKVGQQAPQHPLLGGRHLHKDLAVPDGPGGAGGEGVGGDAWGRRRAE